MTGCHTEAWSRAVQSSEIWELWTVISPKFSNLYVHLNCFWRSIESVDPEMSSSQDYPASTRVDYQPPEFSPSLYIQYWLTINSIYFVWWAIDRTSSPSQPSLYQSSSSFLTREQHLWHVHYRDTVGIQQNLWCQMWGKDERAWSCEKRKGVYITREAFWTWEGAATGSHELRRVEPAYMWRGTSERHTARDIQISRVQEGADSGAETCATRMTVFGTLKR